MVLPVRLVRGQVAQPNSDQAVQRLRPIPGHSLWVRALVLRPADWAARKSQWFPGYALWLWALALERTAPVWAEVERALADWAARRSQPVPGPVGPPQVEAA